MAGVIKGGALTRADKEFARVNARTMTVEAIAAHLGRKPAAIQKELDKGLPPKPDTPKKLDARSALRASSYWRRLQQEFEQDELLYFEDQYAALVAQFGDDILPTEDNQICKAVQYDLLMSQNRVQRKTANRELARLAAEQEKLARKASLTDDDVNWLHEVDEQAKSVRSRLTDLTTEHVRLEERHQKLMEALKATRQQRIEKIESNKTCFLDVIRSLESQDAKDREGRWAKQVADATHKEWSRLASPHTYADGTMDLPLLSPDSVLAAPDEESRQENEGEALHQQGSD